MNPAFDAVFGVFIVLMVGLVVVSVRWAVQRDRAERARRTGLLATEDARAGLVATEDAAVERGLPEGSVVETSEPTASSSSAPGAARARQAPGPAGRRTRARRK
ncbi:MAG: hypothetical protein M0Z82_00425 [Actinomycetota bacterium]|jgi:hypothetical protein|nr:hypothetical protein [Actinomycetota bacterium]